MTAQGSALGNEVRFGIFALKGRNNKPAKHLFRPFRAWFPFPFRSQGGALGFHVPAFQAEERTASSARFVLHAVSDIAPPRRARMGFKGCVVQRLAEKDTSPN